MPTPPVPAPATTAPPVAAVSTPGKLILMGEHAVVYGRPALVAAVDLRLHACFDLVPEGGPGRLRIDLADLAPVHDLRWTEILDYAETIRARWERYAAAPGPESFRALRGGDPLHLVKVALGEALGDEGTDWESLPGLRLRIVSRLPVGSGMGSSAAAAVAVVAGLRACCRRCRGLAEPDPDRERAEVLRLAHQVERRQHGTPSGVDAATVTHGGLLWAERGEDGLATTALAARSPLLSRLAVYDTGTPAEATGAVVAAVRASARSDPRAHERRLDRIAEATLAVRAALAAPLPDDFGLIEMIRACEASLEEMGVVPAAIAAWVREVERAGGAAKISGAGALSGTAAGTVLAFHPEPRRLAALADLAGFRHHPVHLGAAGLRREES